MFLLIFKHHILKYLFIVKIFYNLIVKHPIPKKHVYSEKIFDNLIVKQH